MSISTISNYVPECVVLFIYHRQCVLISGRWKGSERKHHDNDGPRERTKNGDEVN